MKNLFTFIVLVSLCTFTGCQDQKKTYENTDNLNFEIINTPLTLVNGEISSIDRKLYTNEEEKFSFQYPSDWEIIDPSTENKSQTQQYSIHFSNGNKTIEVNFPAKVEENFFFGTIPLAEVSFPHEKYNLHISYAKIDPIYIAQEDVVFGSIYDTDTRTVLASIELKDYDEQKNLSLNTHGVTDPSLVLTEDEYQEEILPFILHVMSSLDF